MFLTSYMVCAWNCLSQVGREKDIKSNTCFKFLFLLPYSKEGPRVVIVGRSAVMAISFRFFSELTGSPPTPLCGDHGGMRRHMPMKFNLEAVFGV